MFLKVVYQRIIQFWDDYNAFERIFWTIIMTLSICGMAIFCYNVIHKYQSDPVSITVETDFIHWNLSFPAVSICLVANTRIPPQRPIIDALNITVMGTFRSFMGKLKPCIFSNPNYLDMDLVNCLQILSENGLTAEDLKKAFLTKDCHDVVKTVVYNERRYNCSDVLKLHLTEYGHCFIINSIIDSGYSHGNLKFKYNIATNNKTLSLRLKSSKSWKYQLFVHSPEDLPSDNAFKDDVREGNSIFSFNSVPIVTGSEAAKISINMRNCRFPHEKLENFPVHYSFSTCISFLRIQLELQHCNCTFSSAPEKYRSQYCDATGIVCLVNGNFYEKACQMAMDQSLCIPPCSEQLITYVGKSESIDYDDNTDISIQISSIPMALYRRTLTISKLDLAVSIAGLAGLFFGASVLNFVELIYYMLRGN